MKRIPIIIILFYFLVLLQTSFLVHFNVAGFFPSFIFILVIILSIFEKPSASWRIKWIAEDSGIWGAVSGGFFLDIFSSGLIGFQILILLAISIFIKLVLKKYFSI